MVNIALIALPNALTSSLSLPLEMLQATSDQLRMQRRSAPRVQLLGLDGSHVTAAGGLTLSPEAAIDWIILAAGSMSTTAPAAHCARWAQAATCWQRRAFCKTAPPPPTGIILRISANAIPRLT